MADIKSLIDKFNIFRTKDSILNDVAKDNGQITIDIKQPFSDDIDSNNSLKTKLETNIKDKLFNTEINNVGSNIFDEKIKPFDKGYNVSNTPDTDTKTPIDTTPIKPDTPTIEKNTADATNIQQEKIQQPEITTPKPKQTQQYKTITEQQKPKLTTDSLGNPMPTNLPKKGTGWSGVGQQQIDDVFNLIKNDEEKFNMFQTYLSEAYNQLKSANLNDKENIIYVPFSYDHENGNMQGITLRFGLGQKEWAEKQLKILETSINDKQNEEWLSNLELPQPEKTMDKMRSNPWFKLFSFMQPPTEGMDPESKRILESGQKENRLNAIKWGLIENIKECKDILDKYYKDKSQVGIALSQKNIAETINNVIFPQIDLVKQSEIASIISKYKEKPKSLTPIENEIVKYYSDYVNALSVVANKTSTGYETTKAIETSLPFMADFLRFNLVGSATRGGTRAAMKIGGKGLARQIAKDTPKTIGARAFKLGEDILTAAGHTSVSPLTFTNMLEDYSQTMETNGQYTKNDLRRGVIEAFTENFSERMFGALKGILPKSNNAFVNSLFGNNPVIKTMQKHMNVGGLLEETGEEYAGAFVNTMFGFALGDEKLASSFKEQLNNSVPTILSIGITVGLPQAIGMGIDFREIKKMNTRFNVAENNLKQYFNKENSYLDINRYSDALKSLYINLNNAKNEEDKTEIKGKIAELNKTAANLAMEKGDSNGFNLISEYSIAAQNSFYVTNKAMYELKNMSEEDRTKLSDNAINKLKNDFTNNLNWSLISRAAAKNITDQNGKQHPTCFLYTDNGVTYVLNGQKDNMFYFVDVNGNTISKSADELRNNENLFVLHLNNLLSFSNKELEDINSKFIDIAQYNAGYRYKVNDNGEIRYYTDNEDLINSNTPYEQIDRDKIESNLVGSYDLVRIDNITNAVEDMANAFAEPAAEQTSTEQTSTEQQKPAQEQPQEQPSEEPIQEQPQEQPQEPAQEQPIQEQQPAQEEDDSTALNGVPDIVDDTPQDARTRGFRRVNGYKIDRQKPLQAVNGKEIAVRFSNDVIANGHVAVIDAEQLQPSHIQGVRNPLHFIDEAQPKERNDEASIVSAQRIAKNIRPEEITSSVTAYTGAPIINARGETIQGNNRSDALRLMWSQNKDQAEKYKQYLIDHAQEFGLNAEDIAAMERPILVNMIDVSDEDAIALGQYVAQDTESGGLERIKPKNAVQKMGADMRTFANLLLSSNDDEISFAGLIDKNGVDVLNWLGQKGYITPTQYKSAFDTKGYITAEAKNDLRGIMYQSIFQGGSTRLEEMFNTMPAKAQKAILATAFRDYDSPKSESMIVEIQNSIRAYYALSQSADFMNAKTYKDVRLAVEGWKKQYQIDDATGESYLPAENFSNFALLLATMYKGEKQTLIQGTFNKLYDLIQGTQEADLFETPDNTPRTLSQAIKEVLNIDYNGQQRNNVLVGDTTTSQRGEQGSTRDAATRERTKDGERTADSAGSIEAESRIAQNEQANTESQGKKPNEVKLMNAVEKLHNKAVAIPGYTVFEYRPEYYTDGSGALVFGNKISASVMPIDDIKTETIADEIKFSVLSPDKRKQYKAASKIRMTSDYAEYLMKFEGYSRADANMIAMRAGKELQFIIKDAKNRLVYDMFLRDVFIPLFEEVLGKEELMNNPIVKNYYDGVFDEVKQHKADAEMHRQFAMTAETAQEPAQEQTTQETAQEQPIQEQTTEEQETTEQEPIQPTQQEQTAQEEDNSTAQNEQANTESQGKKPNIRRIGRVIGSSLSTDEFISETMSIVIKDVKTFPKEIRDEDIISKEQKSGKKRAGIKVKVGLLGNDLYIQYREGRSFANKNKELWEKVKRLYWATIKIPNATNYSAGQLRYRLDYAGTTTDIARIVSDAVLELFHKKELRLHKSSGIGNVSIQEAALRDAIIDKLREAGIDVITDVEEAQRLLDEANGNEIRQQKTTLDAVIEARDNEYLEAVRNGDLDKAQQMVKEAAKSKGYNSNSDYQGTSAFNGKAPYGNGYFLSKEERKEAWENEEFDGESSLGDYIDNGIDGGNIEYFTSNQNFNHTDDMRREAIENLRNVINGRKRTITMYRSVPSDVKEDSFRNGDWVTPSLSYAIENARIHGWGDNFRIIKQEVSIDDVWFDGNDIAEWGYGREEDFIKDTDFAYKNTKNNRKLLDAVTYDDNGNVIPLSERFNESKSDIRFFRTADGNAYGFTVGGKIYIDQRIATADTPIHEYAHIWASAMQKLNPNEWANIVKLMKGTPIWEEVKRNYPELTTDNEIADEVLAFYSGSRGAERLREEHAKILKGNGNVVEKVKAINAIKRVKEALKRFWKNVAEWFGIHFTTAEEVADKVLSDLLNGVNPTLAGVENDIRFEENSEEADIVARAKADGTYMKAPNGKKSNLSPRQWVQVRTKAFKDWFGDWENDPDNSSKVIDENGEPMVVYHGFIGRDFNIFDKDVAFDNSRSAKPVYGSFFFSDTRKQAEAYGSFFRKGERVFNGIKATFLNIKNPFIINSENTPYHSVRGYFKNRDTGEIDWNRGGIVKNGWEIGVQDITIAAMEEGYDGVIFRNIDDAGSEELVGTTHTTLAIFSPTQIKSATDNVGTFDQNNPDIRYQFVGEKGAAAMDKAEEATIRLDNLAVARDMEKAGKDAKDIKLATGWERGAEGKWRYEILDLKYFGKGDAGYKKARGKQSWSKELDSLSDRIFNGEELSEEEQKRFEELAKEEENFKTDYLNREKPYLSDWVENDELFKAYPDLKRVQIVFTDQLPTDIGGIYKYNENTIIVNTNYVDNISSVLAHEVQHAIQYIEGFAKGGSEESVQDLFDRAHSEYMARVWADELEEKAKEMGEYYNQTAVYDALVNDYKGFEDYMPNKEERIKGFNYFVRGYADRSLDNLIEKFRANERVSINSYNEYMKLMGEVEARNVQSRLGMSAEERKRSLAIETEDVERKDQIFLEDGLGVSASEVDKKTNAANSKSDTLYRSDDTMYRIRKDAPPIKTGIGYKVFVLKNGELYPPMVANPNGEATPVGVWLDADAAPIAGQSKTGRSQVKAGGKGTQGGSGKLAYRPGWHLGKIPYALQFNRNDENGERTLFPANFVWAEVEYANDVDYQDEAMSYGYNQNGKFQHSYAGLPRVPINGAYTYRTNPNPETDPWIITGAMRVKRLLTPTEVDEIVKAAGREPQRRQEGAITDEQIVVLNAEIENDFRDGVGSSTNDELAQSERKRMAERVNELAEKLKLDNVEVVTDASTLEGNKKRAKGFYSKSTGKITIVIPNHSSVFDVEQTLLHEAVAHYGLRQLFGEHFDTFLDNVFNNADKGIRKSIIAIASKNGFDLRTATEEYLATLAENTEFEAAQRAGWWQKIKDLFLNMLHRIGFEDFGRVTLTDNELRYILWRSYENLANGNNNILGDATDEAKQKELGVGNYAATNKNSTTTNENDIRYRRASNRSVISSRFERQAEIQREEKNTKSAANIVLGNANVVLNDTNIFDEQYQNAIDNNLIDENVSPLIDSFGITWGYQLKNGVIVINKDVFVSDILDKRVKDNLSLLISSLMKTNKTFFKEGISFFKKLPIWVLYKNDTKSNEDTIKEIINDILLGNTSIDTNKLELLKQYTVQDMNDILDNATKWFEKFEGISSNMFAGNSISDILDTTLGDLMPKEITTTQEGKRLNWFSKLGIDIRSKLFDSLDWFRVVSDKTKDKTASELYDAMIVHTKRVQGKIDIFDKEYVRPIIDTIQSMLGKDFGNSTLSLDLIQEYFAIKSLLGRTASLYKEKFELYLTNHESKKPPMFDEFKQIYDEITEDEIRQRINEMGEKSSMSILQKVDIYYLMEDVRRTLAAEMFVKQYVYSSANTLNQGLQGEQSLGLINEVTNEPYSELYQLLYSDEQSSQTMHSPIEIIEQADILIDRAGLRNEFDFIGNQIQAILNYVNIERVENGLMSYDTFAKRQLMKDFVNQRGENSSEGNLYEITAKQKANEKMKGKDWFNPNSITSIIAVAQTEIATMEKELLAQRLSYFLTNPNNFDVLSQYGMIIDEKETLNEELSEDERNSIMDKNIVLLYGERHTDKNTKGQVDKKKINILKRNDDGTFTKVTISFDNKFIGLEEFVKFVNNNFKYEELRGISKAVAPFTAWTSRIYTILSPLFPTKNLFKDLMVTPWLPAKELNGKNSQYAIKNFYNVFNNLSFILKMSFTEKSFSKKGFENKLKARSQELFEYYLEYSKQHSIFSIEDQIGALSKENKTLQDIEKALSSKENKFIKFTERALLIKFMQHYAELFENLHKFSAYVTLRKLGYGEERSAQIANNATLNYDRSGSIGRQLNAIIPFAKAALGGLYRTNYLLPKYNPKGFLQRVITLAVLGVMQGLMYDPDDDDISEFARKSGMVFGSFLYPLLPEELSIVRPVRALVIVMAGKKSPAYFKQELMESTIDLVPVASDALRGAFSYNPLTNKPEFDVGQLFANTDKMTAVYALAMLASYINENKNSFGKNVLLNEETNTDKTRYGRTKQDYGLYDYLARLYNSILNGVDIDDRAAMSNKIGKNGERLMTIAKEDVEFVINNYIPFGRLYAYTAEIIYDAVNDKRINKGHIPLIGGLFAQKSFGKDYYLVNNIKYELKDFTNDFSQSQIEDIKTNILVKAKNREGLRYKALKDNNANPRMLDKAKQKMNDAFNVFILDINNFVNDNGDKKIDFTEDEYKFMLKSFLDSSIMKKALSIGEDTLNKHTAKRVERTYKRYKKHNNENIDTDKENMKDAAKNFKKMLYDKSITEEEFNDKLNSLYEPLFQQIKLRAKFAGYSIE